MFGSTLGFSRSADRMARFPVSPNPRWRLGRHRRAAILENSNGDLSAADRPIYAVFGSKMGFSGSANRMALYKSSLNKCNRYVGKSNARGVIRLVTI